MERVQVLLICSAVIIIAISIALIEAKRETRRFGIILMSAIIVAIIVSACFIVPTFLQQPDTESISIYGFSGNGTIDDPYRISSVDDLVLLRDLVNEGNTFKHDYFLQTENLNLSSIDGWIPIGIGSGSTCFWGCYDGAGHTIENLVCVQPDQFAGLFGILYGEVRNLGIESGLINGSCVGSIASHGSADAIILNCYNKATVHGSSRAGGLADNFAGQILYSINMGEVSCDRNISGGILSYDCELLDHCYSVGGELITDNYSGQIKKSEVISVSSLTRDFFKDFYQDMKSQLKNYSGSVIPAQMSMRKDNLRFTPSSFSEEDREGFLSLIFFSFLVVLILIFITVDFFANAYFVEKKSKIKGRYHVSS